MPEPDPGFRQGDITLTSVSVSDTSSRDGDRITIRVQFGVARRPVADEFVRVSLTVIDRNNRVVEVIPQEDFDVTIGQQNTVTFDWTLDADPGPHGFLIRIWDPDTLSQEGILLDTRRTGVFTVEETPPPAGPPVPQLLSVSAPTLTPTSVERGGTITGLWRLRNPLNATQQTFLFLDGPGGGSGVAQTFAPGETRTLRATGQVPTSQRLGSVTYGLAVRDFNTQRTIGNLVRAIQINVVRGEAPTPGPVPTPPPQEEEAGIFPGELVAETPSAQPLQVRPGQQVDIGFTFRNQADDGGNLNLLAFPRDPNKATRGTLRATFYISPRGTATPGTSAHSWEEIPAPIW